MASAADINAKNLEFQAAVVDLENANAVYEAAKGPYLVAKQALVDAISRVDVLDDEMEVLTKDFEPQTPPVDA